MDSSSSGTDSELSNIFQGIAFGLLLVFLVAELKQLLPLALLQPAWQLRASEALPGSAPLPLLAGILLMLAQRFNSDSRGLKSRLLLFRRLSMAAAIGFLLLIPLQINAGLRQINQTTSAEASQLSAVRNVAAAIQLAKTPEAMNKAIGLLPGLPSNFQGQFVRPLDQVRRGLLAQIQPQIKRLETRLDDLRRQRYISALGLFLLNSLLLLAYAIAFAALGSSGDDQPNSLMASLWFLFAGLLWLQDSIERIRGRRVASPNQGLISENEWIQSMQEDEE